MSESNWGFPRELQPRAGEFPFDLDAAFDSVVALRAEIPDDAFTAPILGTERAGNGVVIGDDGLVLTIGYLVTEAETIWLTGNNGAVVPGHPLAYDFVTGFGLVQPLGQLGLPALRMGTAAAVDAGDRVLVIGQGGRAHALKAEVFAKREFAGPWEYLIDDALFVTPPHPEWSGAALIGEDGALAGIGSLYVQEPVGEDVVKGNMFVPIDLLRPVKDDLLKQGRRAGPARPWLGLYAAQSPEGLVVTGIAPGGPAERAGVQAGDLIVDVEGTRVGELPEFFRRIWSLGAAGVEVTLTLARSGAPAKVRVKSGDRSDFLKRPRLQ
jgi:S1-C subfamily serine protease